MATMAPGPAPSARKGEAPTGSPRLASLPKGGWPSLLRARRTVQAVALALFLYLSVSTRLPMNSTLPVDLFLRLDPLVQLSASLSARQMVPHLLWAIPLIAATLLMGRFFCGWLCPLGTTLDLVRLRGKAGAPYRQEKAFRTQKYLVLALVLTSAAAGSLFLLPLDPITLALRSFALFLYPALNAMVTGGLFAGYEHGILPDLMVWADTELRGNLLPLEQPYARLSWLFFGLFGVVVGLNALRPRFWCRYLCPLGALLGLVGRWQIAGRRLEPGCVGCGSCAAICRMGAIRSSDFSTSAGECALCGECATVCPNSSISYGPQPNRSTGYDPSRRGFLAAGALGALAVAGFRADTPTREVDEFLVRPPGADPARFLDRCVRCGQCMKGCPSSGLQPSLFQAGLEGLWSPVLVSRVGPCQFDCNLCGQLCPTGAISPLELKAKQATIIGTAYIDQKRCIPWVDGRSCIVCEELCPVSPKAVVLETAEVTSRSGDKLEVKRPRIVRELCIGCGICEHKCPLPGEAAIRVHVTNALLSESSDVAPNS